LTALNQLAKHVRISFPDDDVLLVDVALACRLDGAGEQRLTGILP